MSVGAWSLSCSFHVLFGPVSTILKLPEDSEMCLVIHLDDHDGNDQIRLGPHRVDSASSHRRPKGGAEGIALSLRL